MTLQIEEDGIVEVQYADHEPIELDLYATVDDWVDFFNKNKDNPDIGKLAIEWAVSKGFPEGISQRSVIRIVDGMQARIEKLKKKDSPEVPETKPESQSSTE